METSATWPYKLPEYAEKMSGREMLRAATETHGAKSELARLLRCLPISVTWWAQGNCAPREETRRQLEALLGIPADSWARGDFKRLQLSGYGTVETAGRALQQALVEHGSAMALARASGISAARLSVLRRTYSRPKPDEAIDLERALGIPAAWWVPMGHWRKDCAYAVALAELGAPRPALARALLGAWCKWFVVKATTPGGSMGIVDARLEAIVRGAHPSVDEIAKLARTHDGGALPEIPAEWWAQ